ncbi:MAG: hypothetical protein JW751_02065 [Polyangiaceae bacterium]|nr:hypothetical protein [Polyangiaceae bacterium]
MRGSKERCWAAALCVLASAAACTQDRQLLAVATGGVQPSGPTSGPTAGGTAGGGGTAGRVSEAGAPRGGGEATDLACRDGADNDGDGYVDCEDFDCCGQGLCGCGGYCAELSTCAPPNGGGGVEQTGSPNPDPRGERLAEGGAAGGGGEPPGVQEVACEDGVDNDQDGYVDCEDYDCCWFAATCACVRGTCHAATCRGEGRGGQGGAGERNEGAAEGGGVEGRRDAGAGEGGRVGGQSDSGATGGAPLQETLCADLLDDDADGYVDCEDYDCCGPDAACGCEGRCSGTAVCLEGDRVESATSETNCQNGLDDDADGYRDCEDYDCCGRTTACGCAGNCAAARICG